MHYTALFIVAAFALLNFVDASPLTNTIADVTDGSLNEDFPLGLEKIRNPNGTDLLEELPGLTGGGGAVGKVLPV